MEDEFEVDSVSVTPWDCNNKLEIFSSEGIVRLEIPSQIVEFIAKISYVIVTSVEGTMFSVADL